MRGLGWPTCWGSEPPGSGSLDKAQIKRPQAASHSLDGIGSFIEGTSGSEVSFKIPEAVRRLLKVYLSPNL